MKPTTIKGWLMLAALVLAGAGVLAWALWPRALAVDAGEVSEGLFERTLVRDGKTRLRERHIVTAPVGGRLQRITLREGDAVQPGQVIARMAPHTVALLDARSTDEQRERVAALSAQLQRARVQVAQADAALAQARADGSRSEALAAQGFVSPVQTDAQRLNTRLREAERDAALHDEAAARHQLALAQVALRPGATAAALPLLEVRAPVAGRVIRLHKDSAGEVAQGTALLEVGDLAALEVVVDLLTEEAEQVQPGMPARLGSDAASAIDARVHRIEPGGFTKVSALGVEEQRVNVVLRPEQTSAAAAWHRLGDAWRIESHIVVQRAERVRQLPSSALFPAGRGMAVFVIDGGRARLTPVAVRARHAQQAWIDAGPDAGHDVSRSALAAGAQVVLYPPAALQDGQRVSVRR